MFTIPDVRFTTKCINHCHQPSHSLLLWWWSNECFVMEWSGKSVGQVLRSVVVVIVSGVSLCCCKTKGVYRECWRISTIYRVRLQLRYMPALCTVNISQSYLFCMWWSWYCFEVFTVYITFAVPHCGIGWNLRSVSGVYSVTLLGCYACNFTPI